LDTIDESEDTLETLCTRDLLDSLPGTPCLKLSALLLIVILFFVQIDVAFAE
jgi:hypothetical protein